MAHTEMLKEHKGWKSQDSKTIKAYRKGYDKINWKKRQNSSG